jgi:hypothetical protein
MRWKKKPNAYDCNTELTKDCYFDMTSTHPK